jgi:hypothetical protein
MDFVISLISTQVLLIAGAITSVLWAITRLKVGNVVLKESKVWMGLRPLAALSLGIGAAMLPGVFEDPVGIEILKGLTAGFIGNLLFLSGVAKKLISVFKKSKKKE